METRTSAALIMVASLWVAVPVGLLELVSQAYPRGFLHLPLATRGNKSPLKNAAVIHTLADSALRGPEAP
jgi:hypothetical protein